MIMKKYLLVLGCLFAIAAQAQLKEGRVVYERTIQTPARNFGNLDPEIARQIPRSRTDQFELLFSGSQSLWQYLPSATSDDGVVATGNMVLRFNAGSNDVSYANFEKGVKVDQREIMDRKFVVSDTIAKGDWKMTGETKQILNFTAHKATAQRVVSRPRVTMENGEMKREMSTDTISIVAWYSTDIPVATGPDYQGQLPGMILELETNNGQTSYKAIEVSPKVNAAKIREPKDGKKVTSAEFAKERDKIMEDMRRNMPAGNTIRIAQ